MQIERGVLGQIPYAATGSGPPIVVLSGLSPTTGVASDTLVRAALHPVQRLAATRQLIVLNRRPDLPQDLTMQVLATEHADALRARFDTPVDVLGTSTGGSIAQQLAADHPDTVRRLVLLSTACRLGAHGRKVQAEVAMRLRAGQVRRAAAAASVGLVPQIPGRQVVATAGWLFASRLISSAGDASDLATTIDAEDGFDLAKCEQQIQAPALIIAGSRDRFYSPALFGETAELIVHSRLELRRGRGHITVTRDRAALAMLAEFLG
ncbi:MAG: alpha/beta hydrolase [Actinomycetota bacterium]|nr:alpha/beta hydrolase [Actinomycetota bacterium]